MSRPIHEMRNLGPKTERMLAEIDVLDEGDLRALGAVTAYQRLKFRFGRHVSVLALYAMEAALTDRDWRDLDVQTKERLHRAVKATD